ncbi:AAA family ATPase [Phenylobacterium sp. 20VBR1]|uniref:AAA family ATPase n=1 Tax=Phenylobacterium glaciei TaxID=2803784 RepID=A0A941HXU2_9CAUL|nr:AAA family ATPase [Phenylobacterium glaciei]MBR7620657.1 AAA family ATPase [Phenylobacterium glaciei]QQZ49449.1 AAA family ATPase [Phenylobacterium glaciei]
MAPVEVSTKLGAMPAQIIILNGVGSVGKTSTARALQQICAHPLLHVSMDAFLDMLPPAMFGHADGLVFETLDDGGRPSVAIRTGPVMDAAMRGMRRAIAALAAAGNHLIVDDVILDSADEADYREVLAGFETRFVGLFAPLDVLEARELARGDRGVGLSRWQYDRVHAGRTYDLEIDTSTTTPDQNAILIRDAFGL